MKESAVQSSIQKDINIKTPIGSAWHIYYIQKVVRIGNKAEIK